MLAHYTYRYEGLDICFGFNEDSLTIYDADQPGYIARVTYNGSAYTHQVNVHNSSKRHQVDVVILIFWRLSLYQH